MYKVFLNDWRIVITAPGKITLNKPTLHFGEKSTVDEVRKWFQSYISNGVSDVILTHDRPEYFFKSLFQIAFKTLPAAGGMVRRNQQFLFIFRNNKWDLPKGKIDKDETTEQAALREVEEECGISNHQIIQQLPSTFHLYQSPHKKSLGEWIFKETFWYEMEYTGTENGTPETEENITEIKWFSKTELATPLQNTYANLKPIIQLYFDSLR